MLCVDCHFIDTYSIQLRILIVIYKRPQATIKLWILYGFQLVLFMEGDKMKKNEGRRNLVPSASLSEWMKRTEHNNRQIVKSYFLGFLCVHTIVFLVFDTSNDRPTLLNIQFLCVNLHVIFISLSMFRVSSRWTQCSMFNAHIHGNLIKKSKRWRKCWEIDDSQRPSERITHKRHKETWKLQTNKRPSLSNVYNVTLLTVRVRMAEHRSNGCALVCVQMNKRLRRVKTSDLS